MWKTSFVTTSVLLGASVDDAMAMIEVDAETEDLAQRLRDPRKAERARVLALGAQAIAVAADEVTLR